MMMTYEIFYRTFGVRRATQLMQPRLPVLELLGLPKQSILHYLADSETMVGPPSDEFVFSSISRPIMMQSLLVLEGTLGMPRKVSLPADTIVRSYHSKNRRFRRVVSLEVATRDPNSLFVYNYSVLAQLYRYPRSVYADYSKWWNEQVTIWKNAAETAVASERQQFFITKLPKLLPSVADMRMCANTELTQRKIKLFQSHESRFLLELWKLFGDEKEQSVFANLDDRALAKINIIVQESGRWVVFNLGTLLSWKAPTAAQLVANPDLDQKGYVKDQLQRRVLRLLMALFEVRTVATDKPLEGEPTADPMKAGFQADPMESPELQEAAKSSSLFDPSVNVDDDLVELSQQEKALRMGLMPDEEPATQAKDIVANHQDEDSLHKDLEKLQSISDAAHDEVVPEAIADEELTLEQGVLKVCDRLSAAGMLSAGEYRRYQNLANMYKSLPAPNGQGTLESFLYVPPEALQITESAKIKDIGSVVDKTMLSSSLQEFDSRYIKHVMDKDVAGAVLSLQKAGIAVTSFDVEKVESVLGTYNNYAIRITPVEGSSSTLRFKLPAIQEDGTYMASGVKYRMRKQKGDLPIRKIGPDRVALTSYYGKVFVTRSTKRVNNYAAWLCNHIMDMGLDSENKVVTQLHPAPVFDNKFVCPRLYSTLAMSYRAFVLTPASYPTVVGNQSYALNFDHTKRESLYGAGALMAWETDGKIIIGKSENNGWYLLVDTKDQIFAANTVQPKGGMLVIYPMGTLEGMLGLEEAKAPVEFAQLSVMRQDIPIGVVLGYELGLERLMQLLHVTPRRVPAGTRVSPQPWEYTLVFSDETLVFSKQDTRASIVLAGFNEYHRELRRYSVFEFDQRGVYLNLLESAQATVRQLREIDLLYQMFIDPITRDLLIEMKEPTTFRGLLLRSCEMLMLDHHPDELDSEFMRIKGYERMAGAVYSELVKSLRSHNGRTGKAKLAIDLNPYAVWKNISQDPSIALVSDINPIQNLKEVEAVTYSGTGGRNSRSMTKGTRSYHANDMGTISEATVDSSDVAINTYMSADPQFTSLRGISKRYKIGETGATALLSTSALLAPGSDRDD